MSSSSSPSSGKNILFQNDGTSREMTAEEVAGAVASAIGMVTDYLSPTTSSSNKKRNASSNAENIDEDASPSDPKRSLLSPTRLNPDSGDTSDAKIVSPKDDGSDKDESLVPPASYTKFPAESKSLIWTPEFFPKPASGNVLIYSINQSTSCTCMNPVTMFLVPVGEFDDSEWETLLVAKSFIYTIKDQINDCFKQKEDRMKMKKTFIGTAETDSEAAIQLLLAELDLFKIPDSSIPDHSTVVFSVVTGFIGD